MGGQGNHYMEEMGSVPREEEGPSAAAGAVWTEPRGELCRNCSELRRGTFRMGCSLCVWGAELESQDLESCFSISECPLRGSTGKRGGGNEIESDV